MLGIQEKISLQFLYIFNLILKISQALLIVKLIRMIQIRETKQKLLAISFYIQYNTLKFLIIIYCTKNQYVLNSKNKMKYPCNLFLFSVS